MNIEFIEYKNSVYSFRELDDDNNVIAIHHTTASNQTEAEAEMTAFIQSQTLQKLKAEKKQEILQGFENALNSVFKILSARPIYFKATEYHQERLLKLDNLSDKAIKVYNLNEADYTFDTFDCFDNEGKNLNDQIVSKAEIDEMVLAMGERVLSLEGQRNDKLKASDKAQNETELNNVDITF